jgi:hypothetical protein
MSKAGIAGWAAFFAFCVVVDFVRHAVTSGTAIGFGFLVFCMALLAGFGD